MNVKSLLALIVLCAAALALRLHGLDFLLPHRMEPDGEIVAQVRLLDDPNRDSDWQFGTYGLVTAYAARALPELASSGDEGGGLLQREVAASTAEVLRVRLAVALLSLLLVPATWFLARRWLGDWASLAAAGLAATSLLDLSMAQQARPHAAACALFLLAVLACLRLRRAPTAAHYALAGCAVGLGLGTLQSGLALGLPLAAAHLTRQRDGDRRGWYSGLARPLLALACIAAAVALFYPFMWNRSVSSVHVEQNSAVVQQSGHKIDFSKFNGLGFAKVLWTLWSYDPTLLVLGTLGLFCAARRWRVATRPADRLDALVPLAFALPYLLAIGAFEQTQERFVLPLVPYLAVLAACGIDALERRQRARGGSPWLAGACAMAALVFPTWMNVRLSQVRASEDTIELAAHWIERELDPLSERALVMFPLQLPLFHDAETADVLRQKIPDRQDFYPIATRWLRRELYHVDFERAETPPVRWKLLFGVAKDIVQAGAGLAEYLRQRGVACTVVELFPPARWTGPQSGDDRAATALRQVGRRVARFAPWRDADSSAGSYEYEGLPSHPEAHVVSYLLRAERVGPVVEIYDLREVSDQAPR